MVEEKDRASYVFTWEDVPGPGERRLRTYLAGVHHLAWATGASIERDGGGGSLVVSAAGKRAELALDREYKRALLTTSDGLEHHLGLVERAGRLELHDGITPDAWEFVGWIGGICAAGIALKMESAWLLGVSVLVAIGSVSRYMGRMNGLEAFISETLNPLPRAQGDGAADRGPAEGRCDAPEPRGSTVALAPQASRPPRHAPGRAAEPAAAPGVAVTRGFEQAGEWLKVAVKVENSEALSVHAVMVQLDEAPSALQYEGGAGKPAVELGTLEPGGSQSAIFRFRPTRCVDGRITGFVRFADARGAKHTLDIQPLEVKSICPMLTAEGVDGDLIVEGLARGELACSRVFIEFEGSARAVYDVVRSRLGRLILHEEDWRASGTVYVGSLCYLGRTKYGKKRFAAEFLVSGGDEGAGGLTMAVYSDEPAILTGFFSEVESDLRDHIKVLGEGKAACGVGCAKCGAPLDLSRPSERDCVPCDHCGTWNHLPRWGR